MKHAQLFMIGMVLIALALTGCRDTRNPRYIVDDRDSCVAGANPPAVNFIKDPATQARILSPNKGQTFTWPAHSTKIFFDTAKPVDYGLCYDIIKKKYVQAPTD